MGKVIIAALVVSLLVLGFSAAVFAFSVPIWLPVVLVALSVVLVALMAFKVAKKMRKGQSGRTYRATSGPLTPVHQVHPFVTPPKAPRR